MPQNLTNLPESRSGLSALETELRGEQAATLGRLGRQLAQVLDRLRACPAGDPAHAALVREAARHAWHYFIQRELCGVTSHEQPIADYGIPPEVLAQLGAQTAGQ
jgi:hypothetical protein